MKATALFAATLILAALDGFSAVRAITPDPYGGDANAWQAWRHREKMGTVTNGGAKVVFIGDSITHFWESNGKAQLDRYFSQGDRKVLDLGTSADRTEHVLWRITEGRELDGYEAKCIVLMIGTNNAGHFPFGEEPPTDAILGIRKILSVIAEKQPKATVVLCSIFPRGVNAFDECRRRNDVVNREIMKFADGQRVFWCDFSDRFLTPDGRLTPEIFPDYLHPNALGYEIWYAEIKPYVDYALSDGKLPTPVNRYSAFVRPELFRTTEAAAIYPASKIGEGDWWLDRLERNRNEIADSKGKIDVVLLGDSITHNWEGPGEASLKRLRGKYRVLDVGYSGDRTENVLWRVRNGELDGYEAKCIMLMIGTNNTWHRQDAAADTAAGIRRILDEIAAKQPKAKTLLLPIFPFGDSPKHENRVRNEEVNALIRSFADGERVIWVDFNSKFLDEKGDVVKYMPDRCHPNAAGYAEIWLPSVMPYFERIVGK